MGSGDLELQVSQPSGDDLVYSMNDRPGCIFVVDDEAMVTNSIETMLQLETDHTVHGFNAPKDALAKLEILQPEVVISDFLMPDMDGIEFLAQVKAALPESTLILL
ncbi:MAG: response regulator, partial [Vampirovibrio sp.]|nr:response regulator [Vampirovibrio sp.]